VKLAIDAAVPTSGKTLAGSKLADARKRRLIAEHLQQIEDSPPTAEQTAMFEMFEREGWPHGRRHAYIKARAQAAAAVDAAE